MGISWEMSVMNIYLDLTLWSGGWPCRVPWRDYGKISSNSDSVIPALSPVNQTGAVHVCKLGRTFSFIQKYCAPRVLQVIVCEKISWGFKRGRCEKTLVQNMIYFHWQPGPDLAASTIHISRLGCLANLSELTKQELTRGFPRHNTAQYWRAWEGGGDVLFVSTQRGEGDNLTKWDNDNPVREKGADWGL